MEGKTWVDFDNWLTKFISTHPDITLNELQKALESAWDVCKENGVKTERKYCFKLIDKPVPQKCTMCFLGWLFRVKGDVFQCNFCGRQFKREIL